MAFDSTRNLTVLFGGGGSNYLDDLWEWNGTTWTLRTATVRPEGRKWASGAYDPTRQRFVVFGGFTTPGPTDTAWEWNGTAWTPRTLSPRPAARYAGAMAFDPSRGKLVMFGGTSVGITGALGDTWTLDANGWTQLALTGPSARAEHKLVWSPTRQRLVLAGGLANGVYLTDAWELGPSGWSAIPNDVPVAVGSYAAAWDGRAVALVGGGAQTGYSSSMWEFDGTWTSFSGPVPTPARTWPAAAWDSTRARLVFFGGTASAGDQNDTWEFW